MIERTLAARVLFAWVAADTAYRVGEVGMALRLAGKGCMPRVTGTHQVRCWGVQPWMAETADNLARRSSSRGQLGAAPK